MACGTSCADGNGSTRRRRARLIRGRKRNIAGETFSGREGVVGFGEQRGQRPSKRDRQAAEPRVRQGDG